MFADSDDLKAIASCGGRYATVAPAVKRVVDSSTAGKSMFKAAWLVASRAMFQNTILDRLKNLKDLEYAADELASFKKVHGFTARNIQSISHKVSNTCKRSLIFVLQN